MMNIERGSVLRTFFALLTLHTWFSGLFEPRSMHFLVTQKAAGLGMMVVTAFGFLGLLALVDTLVNDFWPQYKMPTLLENRHLIFMLISVLNAAELFVSIHYIASWGLALYCLLVSVFVAITAFLDICVRYKLPIKGIRHAHA